MTPERLRAYVLIFTRDVVPCLAGTFLVVYLALSKSFAPWQLPLIAALYGVPFVAPRNKPDNPDEPE